MSELRYKKDGVDHINIHSNANTELGRRLDNLSREPFDHPEYGHFESVEGFYWYLVDGEGNECFRTLHGHEARKMGNLLQDRPRHLNGRLAEQVAKASVMKVQQNPDLARLLRDSTLPLTCYRRWGKKVKDAIAYQNHATVFELLRNDLSRYVR